MRCKAPVLPPNQAGTGSKFSDWPAARAVRRNGPVPTSVSGFVNQVSSPAAAITLRSTTQNGHSPTRVVQYAARLVRVEGNVNASIFTSPLSVVARPLAHAL